MAIQDQIPQSRITLRYRTEIFGEPEDIVLPLRLLVIGDFSGKGASEKAELEERKIWSFNGKNTPSVIKNMDVRFKLSEDADVMDSDSHITIEDMDSFDPESVIGDFKTLKKLLFTRKMLQEVSSALDNSKKFRKAMIKMLAPPKSGDANGTPPPAADGPAEELKKLFGDAFKEADYSIAQLTGEKPAENGAAPAQ